MFVVGRVLLATSALLFLCFGYANASSLNQHEEECYAVAMVGYDTVINSDLGLPLDEVISTMVMNNNSFETIDIYQDFLLLVVMEAYNWEGSPHSYAVKTIYQCAAKHNEIAHN